MGDRGNVIIKGRVKKDGTVISDLYLYTHWCGSDLPEIVAQALKRAIENGRNDDAQYLARIVFCEMLKHDTKGLDGTDGFGISTSEWDGGAEVIIDVENNFVESNREEWSGTMEKMVEKFT